MPLVVEKRNYHKNCIVTDCQVLSRITCILHIYIFVNFAKHKKLTWTKIVS